jgi:hypothetical protein
MAFQQNTREANSTDQDIGYVGVFLLVGTSLPSVALNKKIHCTTLEVACLFLF